MAYFLKSSYHSFKNINMENVPFIVIALLFVCIALHAQKQEVMLSKKAGWHKITEASVNLKTEKDEFLVMGADRFRANTQKRIEDCVFYISYCSQCESRKRMY
jgi:hypothetical protein